MNSSAGPSGSVATTGPVTSSRAPAGAPPPKVGVQASDSTGPLTSPSRFEGADGGTGTFTWATISFDGPLTPDAVIERSRMKNEPVGRATVTAGVAPSGNAPMTEPGVGPPSSCRAMTAGPDVGSVHAIDTVVPLMPVMRKFEGGCGPTGGAGLTVSETVTVLPGPTLFTARYVKLSAPE